MRPGVLKYYKNLEVIFSQLPDSYADHLPRLKMIRETIANLPYEKFFRDQAVFAAARKLAPESHFRAGIVRLIDDAWIVGE